MATVTTVIDAGALRELLASPSGPAVKRLIELGRQVQNRAKQLCPVDTGRLRASITMTPVIAGTDVAVQVGTNVKYAPWVHNGRGPVRPVNAKVLRWQGPNGPVFSRYSRPVKGRPFLRDALAAIAG